MIGKEIGLAGHLFRGVVDIGDRGLPTRSHRKMGEVIVLTSRRRGGVELGRNRDLSDGARRAEHQRDEIGSGSKRRVGLPGDDDLLVARGSCGGIVRDDAPTLNGVVFSIADMQIHVDIRIDGFQREGYAGGALGNLHLE